MQYPSGAVETMAREAWLDQQSARPEAERVPWEQASPEDRIATFRAIRESVMRLGQPGMMEPIAGDSFLRRVSWRQALDRWAEIRDDMLAEVDAELKRVEA